MFFTHPQVNNSKKLAFSQFFTLYVPSIFCGSPDRRERLGYAVLLVLENKIMWYIQNRFITTQFSRLDRVNISPEYLETRGILNDLNCLVSKDVCSYVFLYPFYDFRAFLVFTASWDSPHVFHFISKHCVVEKSCSGVRDMSEY